MKVILFGAPGAGKGTVADQIALNYQFKKISTGDLIRQEIKNETELGKRVKAITGRGELVDDLTVIAIVKNFLSRSENASRGYIFDGFPRTLLQAKELTTINPQEREISFLLKVDKDLIIKRLTSRLTCISCNAIYNQLTNPPRSGQKCDLCGGKLIKREDDNEQTICKRIEVYLKETAPVIDYYRQSGKLIEIDASGTVDDVFQQIAGHLNDQPQD